MLTKKNVNENDGNGDGDGDGGNAARLGDRRSQNNLTYNLAKKLAKLSNSEKKVSNNTQVFYTSDGHVKELVEDPTLSKYSDVIIDEFHDRSVPTDPLVAMLKSVVKGRSYLKLVIMSTTLNADRLSKYFNNAPAIKSEGRQYERG
ncbi:hypothetical protein PG993_004167 [Apiospora rasikravindrae]|uniref:Helicase ATP-binding domain-containing protein n=1 Tax=Apiospora rasikravindrae TaxID=990691 RepID=A0ABR1TC04_9PEZI